MSETENLSFTKLTNWKFFNLRIFSKEEVYSEISSEGEPFKIVVTQDYYNKEFKVDGKQNNL